MEITLNGEYHQLADGSTIAQLIEQLNMKPRYVAVERNLDLIPRCEHDGCVLENGDQLEVVTLVGGG